MQSLAVHSPLLLRMAAHRLIHRRLRRRQAPLPRLDVLPITPLLLDLLIVAPHIPPLVLEHHIRRNAQNTVQPEYINALQGRQQREGDILADPAFVLFGFPVQLVGADGCEGGEDGVENA